ncbi:MAG: hypothetical protein ACLFMX_02680 [Halobacteriales archaeon]
MSQASQTDDAVSTDRPTFPDVYLPAVPSEGLIRVLRRAVGAIARRDPPRRANPR